MFKLYRKTILNRTVALLLLIPLSPLLAVTYLLVRFKLGTPVLFRQKRIGLNNQPFMLYKFRTMTSATDHNGKLLPDEQRMTGLGRFLRKTSLDELPQLLNILKGDMNFIGPRPLLPHFLPYYTEEELLRHTIHPGITGWAQVNGRNLKPWDERLIQDIWYVKNKSLWLDIKILFLTVVKVFTSHNAAVTDRENIENFTLYRQPRQKQS